MPDIELGVNDLTRMGLEVVGRHDILPVPTEQWIRYQNVEFHPIVDKKEFEKNDHIIKYVQFALTYLFRDLSSGWSGLLKLLAKIGQ